MTLKLKLLATLILLTLTPCLAETTPKEFVEEFAAQHLEKRWNSEYDGFEGSLKMLESERAYLAPTFYQKLLEIKTRQKELGHWIEFDVFFQTSGGNVQSTEVIKSEASGKGAWAVVKYTLPGVRGNTRKSECKYFLESGGDHGWLISNISYPAGAQFPEATTAKDEIQRILDKSE